MTVTDTFNILHVMIVWIIKLKCQYILILTIIYSKHGAPKTNN